MKGEPGTSRGFKFFCMVVLCLSLIVGGAYFVNKCAFADENDKWPGWGYNSPNMSFNYTDFNQNGFYNYFQYGFPYLTPSGTPAVTPTPTETPVVTTTQTPAVTPTQTPVVAPTGAVVTPPGTYVVSPGQTAGYDGRAVPGECDIRVIPDKYNTGCQGNLTKITGSMTVGGIELKESNGTIGIDFFYRNTEASGTYVIENMDFSGFNVSYNSESKVSGKKINIVFNNCKFSAVTTTMRAASDVFTYTYNNCTIRKFNGSNSTFNRCKFGDSYSDCIVPFSNVTVNDCYLSNLASDDPNGNGTHSDGTQMYGHADSMVQNVTFSHCRFEIPAVKSTKSTAAVNACIMLSLEYNNANNLKFEDCLVNGGGYSIYCGRKNPEYWMKNVYFTNIKIGAAKLFGNIYPTPDENAVFTNVGDQDSLYVSSVWNDGSKTHVIVSNDTDTERTLRVVTGSTTKDFKIEACAGGKALRYDIVDKPFSEFPFDIDITVDGAADYVLCYDVTDGKEKQIRYVSFSGTPVDIGGQAGESGQPGQTEEQEPEEEIIQIVEPVQYQGGMVQIGDQGAVIQEKPISGTPAYITEGSCGTAITYRLDQNGTLTIEGKGAMDNYHSEKLPPWSAYSDRITSVKICEGVTNVGSAAFKGFKNITSVELPKTVTVISSNAFSGCKELQNISFYNSVKTIEKYAFNGVSGFKCTYYGMAWEWKSIKIGKNNDGIKKCEKNYASR